MACVISAPSSNSGKTLLSLILCAWARKNNLTIQPFKVGPDYLDPQLLSAVSNRSTRNLDIILCGVNWVKQSFYQYGTKADLTVVEGVMGLFDGLGDSVEGSTAQIADTLGLPVILIIDAKGQANSLGALVNGFKNYSPKINISGVVVNHVNSTRHKKLLKDVLNKIGVKMVGCIPSKHSLVIPSRHLGLSPAHEIKDLNNQFQLWASIAEETLDIKFFSQILKSPKRERSKEVKMHSKESKIVNIKKYPIAVVQDNAFHFRYSETKEYLEKYGMPCLSWKLIEDEPIPKGAKGIIIPGGFPEQYAEQISKCDRSMGELKRWVIDRPIYAECGGMLILGKSLTNLDGKRYPMAGILPFEAKKGKLSIGYRKLKFTNITPISSPGEIIYGHEFHRWQLSHEQITTERLSTKKLKEPWKIKGWDIKEKAEGWSDINFHASWIHLHWASSINIIEKWRETLIKAK